MHHAGPRSRRGVDQGWFGRVKNPHMWCGFAGLTGLSVVMVGAAVALLNALRRTGVVDRPPNTGQQQTTLRRHIPDCAQLSTWNDRESFLRKRALMGIPVALALNPMLEGMICEHVGRNKTEPRRPTSVARSHDHVALFDAVEEIRFFAVEFPFPVQKTTTILVRSFKRILRQLLAMSYHTPRQKQRLHQAPAFSSDNPPS